MDLKQIEREIRNEELKAKFTKPAIVLAMIVFGLLTLYAITPKPLEHNIELLNGITLEIIPVSSSYDYDSAMMVKLDNGNEVRVPIKNGVEFKKDSVIEIKQVTSAGGTVSFQFSRYISD